MPTHRSVTDLPGVAELLQTEPDIIAASNGAAAPIDVDARVDRPENALRAQRFRCGSLDAWRAALFVSLGWSAAACGGDVAPSVSEDLQCAGDSPLPGRPGQWLCENGIVHRPEPIADDGPCTGCVGPTLTSRQDECENDGDCADGALCVESSAVVATRSACGTTITEVGSPFFACQSPADRCGANRQCSGGLCALEDGARRCFTSVNSGVCGVPGRPFLVNGELRVASLRAGAGWCDAGLTAIAPDLDSSLRARAAAHYQQAALLEHASIAAFARFTLQLLELGAPLSLVAAAQQAMGDETVHAQLCFTLATRYAGQPIAPGALSMSGALAQSSLDAVAQLCLLEGCIGETLAALEAAEALAAATDPEVRAALDRVTRDELRHAELAFRFLTWALEQSQAPGLRRSLASALDVSVEASLREFAEGAVASLAAPPDSTRDASLERHGVLSEPRRRWLRRAALERVVVPCVRRLLAEARPRGAQPPVQASA